MPSWAVSVALEPMPETPIYLDETTSKPIIDFKSYEDFGDDCDFILTRDENNPDAPLERRRVLRKFIRSGPVLNLHVGGRIIGTTAEHPFRVAGKGWVPTFALEVGDVLLDFHGPNKQVEGIADSGRVTTVINLEVEGCHTYFVGEPEWGFAVWAHNADYNASETPNPTTVRSNARLILRYLKEIEVNTGIRVQGEQRQRLFEYFRNNKESIRLLSAEETDAHRWSSSTLKSLRREWQKEMKQEWPKYTQQEIDTVPNMNGARKVGGNYDAHEIIPNQFNAPHEWWNLLPARYPDYHQGGIHGQGSAYQQIIKRFGG